MKATINRNTVLFAALLAGFISVTGIAGLTGAPGAVEIGSAAREIETVSIHHQRMSVEEKIAFDTENTLPQTVLITAKRLTREEKIALVLEDQSEHLVVFHHKTNSALVSGPVPSHI